MQEADKTAIEKLRIGEVRLMELAGRECLRVITGHFGHQSIATSSFLIICGKGNNGGDGFVLARHLLNQGASVDLVLLYPEKMLRGVNREGLSILEAYEARLGNLRIFKNLDEAIPQIAESRYDLVIDAILGTGLRLDRNNLEIPSPLPESIELINSLHDETGTPTLSIDIPSGLDATTGMAATTTITADLTVTMAFAKRGCYLNSGPRCSGEIHIAEISIPPFLLHPAAWLIEEGYAAEHFQLREPDSNKGTNGKILMIAGSASEQGSMLGAAIMAARAAIKTGAGYLCTSIPLQLAPTMHLAVPEAIVTSRSISGLIEKIRWADIVLIGCGIGRDNDTRDLLTTLLRSEALRDKPLILDADALFFLRDPLLRELAAQHRNTLLTPHQGEYCRLCGKEEEEIMEDTVPGITALAEELQATLLFKGAPTIIAEPGKPLLFNTSGTEALATAGTGDVLAGMIAAIASRGCTLAEAAATAAWFHGRAGDLASDVATLVTAGMLIEAIPQAIGEIFAREPVTAPGSADTV